MRINVYNKFLKLFAGVMFILMLASCLREQDVFSGNGKNDEAMVTFTIQVPGTRSPGADSQTRAIEEKDENQVTDIDILVFESGGNGKFLYKVGCSGKDIVTDPGNFSKKTFTVRLRSGDCNLVIFANSRSIINTATLAERTKNEVLASLQTTMAGKWPATSSTEFTPFPMWGDVGDKDIREDVKLTEEPVRLVRMVASVDVMVNSQINNFVLTSVDVYNYNTAGTLVPAASGWDVKEFKASEPNVPTSLKPTVGPLTYAADRKCEREIYLFEAENHSDDDHKNKKDLLERTCLVVGGKYDGDANPTYYRIDFAKPDANSQKYLDVMRNHKYIFSINSVSGRGYGDSETAFKSAPVNIEAAVIDWSDVRFTEFAFDGQYLIGVSQGEFNFLLDEQTADLGIVTDYPGGWKVEKIVHEDGAEAKWVTCTPDNGTGSWPNGDLCKLEVKKNETGKDRTAFVHIKAGRLTYIVKVNQSTVPDIGISLTDLSNKEIDILKFSAAAGTQPAAQEFNLSWKPASNDLFCNVTALGNPFTFDNAAGSDIISVDNQPEAKTYKIQPPAITPGDLENDPFYERKSVVLYTVSNGVTTVNKTLTLHQLVYNVKPKYDANYIMDGGKKSFSVRSNADFKVEVTDNPDNVISMETTLRPANTTADGETVEFDIVDDITNPKYYYRIVKFTISSPQNLFTPVTIELNCVSGEIQDKSNSYIVAPASKVGILIPVSRANESENILGKQLLASDEFTAELVWTENSYGVNANSNIRLIKPVRNASVEKSYVLVMPGTGSGNALVAIKKEGRILWSWHIWVTEDTPKELENGWMDRNLGAMSGKIGDPGTLGLYYQWGRKDPFARAKSFSIESGGTKGTEDSENYSGTVDLFDSSGNKIIPLTRAKVTAENNLLNAVANPTTFYYGGHDEGWYGLTSRNDLLWVITEKTIYDPCPPGYRVPRATDYGYPDNPDNTWADNGKILKGGKGGYYPYGGIRTRDTYYSLLSKVGTDAVVWTALNGTRVAFNNSNIGFDSSDSYKFHAYGNQIRCIKIKE